MAAGICNRNSFGMRLGALTFVVALSAVPVAFGVDARILVGPENHMVPLELYINFSCIAEGESPSWFFNGTIVDNNTKPDGFRLLYSRSSSYNHTLTMSVPASLQNNNTVIICRVYGSGSNSVDYSSPAKLIVMGPPSAPDLHLYVFSATMLQLSWLPPFTWMEYPIVNYAIQIHNRDTGEVMNRTILNVTSTLNSMVVMSPVTFNFSTPHGEVVWRCEELVFTVNAISNIGQSEPGEVNGGFPIDPDPDNSSIEIPPITFQSDSTPLLKLHIQLPNICHFQDLNYTIVIKRIQPSHDTITGDIVIGPKTVRGQTEVLEAVNNGLVANAVYLVSVDMDTVAGSVSTNTTFETHFQPPTVYMDSTATNGTHSQLTTDSMDTSGTSGAGISSVGKIAIGVSTSIFITAASGMVLILCAYVLWKRKAEDESAEKACKSMVPNPIYEGPLYETIQPEFCTLTTLGPATDLMESRYLDKPIHPAMPLEASENGTAIAGVESLSQVRGEENENREDCSLEVHCVPIPGATLSSEDNYTVMSPVGTLSHSLQGGWGIPDQFDQEKPDKSGFK